MNSGSYAGTIELAGAAMVYFSFFYFPMAWVYQFAVGLGGRLRGSAKSSADG